MIFSDLNILPYFKNHFSSKSSHIIIRATPPFLRWDSGLENSPSKSLPWTWCKTESRPILNIILLF